MNRKCTARILNLDRIIPQWRDYVAGFYDPPSYAATDVLILGISLPDFHFGDGEKEVLSFYSRFMDYGSIHTFICCHNYSDLSLVNGNGLEGTEADICVRKMSTFSTDLPYTGTLLYHPVASYSPYQRRDGILLARMLQSWGEGQHPCQGGPLYRPDIGIGSLAMKRGYAHFHYTKEEE